MKNSEDISGMHRRELLQMLRNLALLSSALPLSSCSSILEDKPISVEEQRQRVRDTSLDYALNEKGPVYWNVPTIVHNLTTGLPPEQGRVKLFEFVQNFPYEVVHYDGTTTDLLAHERGDCRHKRELLFTLLENYKQRVRKVGVVFNWADLPVPKEILQELKSGGTKGLHSCLEVQVGDQWIYVEPSWDSGLEKSGFPIVKSWDGKSPTTGVTLGKTVVYPHPYNIGEIMKKHGVRYVTSETNVFDRRLNSYLRSVRPITHPYDLPLEDAVQAARPKK